MPNDYITLKALAAELNDKLKGAKIDKIYQPEKDEITLHLRTFGSGCKLVISVNAENPRIHLSEVKKENPVSAPNFCMHLRKRIGSGVIEGVSLINNDRIMEIKIRSMTEMKDAVTLRLIAEMMGRYSNLLLVGDNGKIIDALKLLPFDSATKRCLLPSFPYIGVIQNKTYVGNADEVTNILSAYEGGELSKYIYTVIAGVSESTAREAVARADIGNTSGKLSAAAISKLTATLISFTEIYSDKLYAPCVSLSERGAEDYFVMPYKCLEGKIFKRKQSLSEAISDTVSPKDAVERHRQKIKNLSVALKRFVSRTQRRLEKTQEKLAECNKIDEQRLYGELLTANLYRVKKGDGNIECRDYSAENAPIVNVPLDKKLTPTENSAAFFKRYNKLKRTKIAAEAQMKEASELIEYARSIESSLETSRKDADISSIENELAAINVLNVKRGKIKKRIVSSPITYKIEDYTLYVGKNNEQNDKLTFKTANGGDMWLHVHGTHGSHAILVLNGKPAPQNVLLAALEITAYYSKGRASGKQQVDYTPRKHVKRHPNGKLGMVIYSTYESVTVQPNERAEYRISD